MDGTADHCGRKTFTATATLATISLLPCSHGSLFAACGCAAVPVLLRKCSSHRLPVFPSDTIQAVCSGS